jgi:tetratricopeptide (TPR) repeat protein
VSGDLKEQIVPVGDVGAPGKEYSAACKVAMILRTAKYIASLALFFSTVSFSSAVFAQRPSSNQVVLAPKIQRELGRALEALRNAKPEQALSHLEAAYRAAPNHPAVNYLFGVYCQKIMDHQGAISHWTKTIEFDPKHVLALLSLSEALKYQDRLPEAGMYATRAVEADPSSWRGHAILAEVLLKEHFIEDGIKEADHALALGHEQAEIVQPLRALAMAEGGNKELAARVLIEYIQGHPKDTAARKQLERFQAPEVPVTAGSDGSADKVKPAQRIEPVIALPLPSNWLPPDVDERVPPVEPKTVCLLEEVVQKAGMRIEEFVTNVDRFTATEFLEHESIDKWGFAQLPETRKFDYVVSIEQYRPGYFEVIEYRGNKYSPAQSPDGVETRGLPSMVLIFHPNNAGNFAMSCEGLGQWNGAPAWQVHFRQRPDKPKTTRGYRIGENGVSYPVALRGRAWIAADSYQIVRMETDLGDTLPEIRLLTDHVVVEYGPVRFKHQNVEMWLPQSAELYSDWRGKRMHRRYSFSNYILCSVDEKQSISELNRRRKSEQRTER